MSTSLDELLKVGEAEGAGPVGLVSSRGWIGVREAISSPLEKETVPAQSCRPAAV